LSQREGSLLLMDSSQACTEGCQAEQGLNEAEAGLLGSHPLLHWPGIGRHGCHRGLKARSTHAAGSADEPGGKGSMAQLGEGKGVDVELGAGETNGLGTAASGVKACATCAKAA
jgi:hypothetical protein